MPLNLDDILALDEFSPEQRQAVLDVCENDPQLRSALVRWSALRRGVRSAWETDVPGRHALVLVACKEQWSDSDLSAEESAELEDASNQLATAIESHPALTLILDRIRQEAADFESAWSEASKPAAADRSAIQHGPLRPRPALRLVRMAMATAAVIALVFVGRAVIVQDAPSFPTYAAADVWTTVELEDGTEVRLGPGSVLETESAAGDFNRNVTFSGQGYFDVAHSTTPFVIESGDATTTVLGTEFAVDTESGTEVTLVSGRVLLAPVGRDDLAVELAPGERGSISSPTSRPDVAVVSVASELSWLELLIFRDTPMSEVAESLAKTFDVRIELGDSLSETPLTGTFESDRGIDVILEIISSALGAQLDQDDDGTYRLSIQEG